MIRRLTRPGLLLLAAVVVAGCATGAGSAFKQGDAATRAGNLDDAVVAYRRAVQTEPDNAEYRVALQRSMLAASRAHLARAQQFESQDQLEAAVGEYRAASEYDPSNRMALGKVGALERAVRDRAEAARPRPAIQDARDRARAATAPPILNPASREPLNLRGFNNVSRKDVLAFIAMATGINITYDRDVTDAATTIQLDGVTLEQALNQIMAMNQLSYKVISERSIFVFQDSPPKHQQYDEQVVQTFYLSHANPTELSQVLSTIVRVPGMAITPRVAVNTTTNTITVAATSPVMQIIQKIVDQHDKPRAEIVVDVEILEVDRSRAKSYGLNLSEYALGAVFSPDVSPSGATTTTGTGTTATTTTSRSTSPSGLTSPPAIALGTFARASTGDLYLAIPTAIVRFLETDTNTKVMAKPQLRGAEGTKISLKLGQQIPVVSTSYTPIATGGAGVNPLSSYQYKDVGVNVDMTPRVSLEGDIVLDIFVEDLAVGADKAVAGVTVPSFVNRSVTSRLRLRDGESNLLAGLLQQSESRTTQGFPGTLHVPILRHLFGGNSTTNDQTEIVVLLTPHIVRTGEITEEDLKPIFIGSQQNLGLGGPPPLIAAPEPTDATPTPAAPAPGTATPTPPTPTGTGTSLLPGPGGTLVAAPAGSSPVPGTVLVTPVPATPSAGDQAEPATTSPGFGMAQVITSPPGTAFRVGGGPYTVPLSIANATRLSTITLTLMFDPTKLRVRAVQEGSFMRAGATTTTFGQQVDTAAGRIDIAVARASDSTGASGTGLLGAVLFDAVAPGAVTLLVSGTATGPGGTPMGLQFRPVTITVQP